jgi:2-C-methyl-D-erythritol 4-phosphate cytidylyltransferase
LAGVDWLILLAGGSGERAGQGPNKVYRSLEGRPLLAYSLEAVRAFPRPVGLVIVARQDDRRLLDGLLGEFSDLAPRVVLGGATRFRSEVAGLGATRAAAGELIGIHDGARPFLTAELWSECIGAAATDGGAIPVVGSDRIFRIAAGRPSRLEGVVRAQTPQVFGGRSLLEAFARAEKRPAYAGFDTAETFSRFSEGTVAAVPGEPRNLKVTTSTDFERARTLVAQWSPQRWLPAEVG